MKGEKKEDEARIEKKILPDFLRLKEDFTGGSIAPYDA